MRIIPTTLLALLLAATAQAQAPKPAQPALPAKPARPATPASAANVEQPDEHALSDEEELQVAAVEALMAQPSERSLPILKKVLAGQHSTKVKRRALFVLAQINSPEAHDMLMQVARTPNPELQREAIRSIGISGDAKSLDALQEVYKTADPESKKAILQSWMIAGRKEAVYQAAVNAKTEDEASDAIHMLGVMGATEELRKLGDKPAAPRSLLDALAISGDLEGLRKMADTSTDPGVRVEAVRRIGIIHSPEARTALRDIYVKATDPKIRQAALQGMQIAGDDQGVLALYRAAKTTDEKRSLLRTLSMMNGDAAIEAIDATLEKKP
jgi:HEAT repeat protein